MNGSPGRAVAPSSGAAEVLLLLAMLLLFCPPPVRAHAIVLESTPAHDAALKQAPDRVVLRFNSKIEKRLTRVTLTTGGGAPRPVPIASAGIPGADGPDRIVVPLPPLGSGTHVLRYRVLSADGHITQGALRFTVSGTP